MHILNLLTAVDASMAKRNAHGDIVEFSYSNASVQVINDFDNEFFDREPPIDYAHEAITTSEDMEN